MNDYKLRREDTKNSTRKAASEEMFSNNKSESENKSTLLIKKEKIRELWKEKFMNWNEAGKAPKKKSINDLKFPNINTSKI